MCYTIMPMILEDILKQRTEVKKYSDEVSLVEINDNKYILKKIVIPFKEKEISSQHLFINYLFEQGIKVSRLYGYSFFDSGKKIYELQEYIEHNNDIDYDNLIISLAKFHTVSKLYPNKYNKKNVYKHSFICKNIKLDVILLDFKNKYYLYPLKNYKRNRKNLFDEEINKDLCNMLQIYNTIYKEFIKSYNLNSCIIHNDITSNNVICNNGDIYFIDFDLSIIGTEYVDFVDALIKRHQTLEQISNNFEQVKNEIINKIKLYNEYNTLVKLEYSGAIKMLLLKLMSVNLYLMYNVKNFSIFKENFPFLRDIVFKIGSEVL